MRVFCASPDRTSCLGLGGTKQPRKLSFAGVADGMTSTLLAEQRLALAVDAARLGSWMWDMKSGVTTWDERLEEMHGLAPGGFGGTFEDWVAALHPDDRATCIARVEQALASPVPTRSSTARPGEMGVSTRSSAGEWCWWTTQARPSERPEWPST